MKMLLVVFLSLIVIVLSDDYCSQESDIVCDGLKHIGCPKSDDFFNNWTKNFKDFKPILIESKQKTLILHEINNAKNRVAGGELTSKGYKKASDFPVMKWHDELEKLTSLSVGKIPMNKNACVVAKTLDSTFLLKYRRSFDETETEDYFIQRGAEFFGNFTQKQNVPWFSTYFGYSKYLGCSAAEYVTDNVKQNDLAGFYKIRVFHCLFEALSEDLNNYNTGEPCSKCKDDKVCDAEFTNLCAQ